MTRMTQNKNNSMTLCSRKCKWKVATTYLAVKTKNN